MFIKLLHLVLDAQYPPKYNITLTLIGYWFIPEYIKIYSFLYNILQTRVNCAHIKTIIYFINKYYIFNLMFKLNDFPY